MFAASLPPNVFRDQHAVPFVGLHNCHALQFEFEGADDSSGSCIVWRSGMRNIEPVDAKRLTELRPGDKVLAFGQPAKLVAVMVYR